MKILKKVLAAILLLSLSLASCSKEEDDDLNLNSTVFLGTWVYENKEALDAEGNFVWTEIEDLKECASPTIHFLANDEGFTAQYKKEADACKEFKLLFDWKTEKGQLLLFPVGADPDSSTFTYKISGDLLELVRPLKRAEVGEYELHVTQLKFTYKKR